MRATAIYDTSTGKITTTAFGLSQLEELMDAFQGHLDEEMSEDEANTLIDSLDRAEEAKAEHLEQAWISDMKGEA